MAYKRKTNPLCLQVANNHQVERIIRIEEMLKLLRVSRTTLYRWTQNKTFLQPIMKGQQTLGWKVSSYQQWLDQQP